MHNDSPRIQPLLGGKDEASLRDRFKGRQGGSANGACADVQRDGAGIRADPGSEYESGPAIGQAQLQSVLNGVLPRSHFCVRLNYRIPLAHASLERMFEIVSCAHDGKVWTLTEDEPPISYQDGHELLWDASPPSHFRLDVTRVRIWASGQRSHRAPFGWRPALRTELIQFSIGRVFDAPNVMRIALADRTLVEGEFVHAAYAPNSGLLTHVLSSGLPDVYRCLLVARTVPLS
jgi:hypothetical protein